MPSQTPLQPGFHRPPIFFLGWSGWHRIFTRSYPTPRAVPETGRPHLKARRPALAQLGDQADERGRSEACSIPKTAAPAFDIGAGTGRGALRRVTGLCWP
jgi:hypothetical protein